MHVYTQSYVMVSMLIPPASQGTPFFRTIINEVFLFHNSQIRCECGSEGHTRSCIALWVWTHESCTLDK